VKVNNCKKIIIYLAKGKNIVSVILSVSFYLFLQPPDEPSSNRVIQHNVKNGKSTELLNHTLSACTRINAKL
jgi:hypothetical protein